MLYDFSQWAIWSICVLHLVATTFDGAAAAAERPNVIVLLADDLGWTGLRSFGSDFYETPNLDRMAAGGMRFTDAYAACTVCSPTRASLLTGMYPAKLHLTDFIAGQNRPWARLRIPDWTKRLESRHVTIAEALKQHGYFTAQVGKWHLAGPGEGAKGDPTQHGFDVQVLKPRSSKGYFLRKGSNEEGESKSDYLTDYLTDRALQIIDERKDQPFFLYFAYHTPHTPIQGRADLVKRYAKKLDPQAEHNNPTYAAMVHSLDESVGRILARLKKNQIDKRTIVMFLSDNGGLTQRYGKPDNFTSNAPLRRGKGSAYEGGVRVPAIVRWPGEVEPGSVCHTPIMTIDVYPTILAWTGAKGAAEHNSQLDGVSLIPLLQDPNASFERALYWHYPHYHAGGDSPYSAVRQGNHRLIHFHEDDRHELYDLSRDLGEQTDIAATSRDRVKQLAGLLDRWRSQVDAQMPTANPNFDPQRATQVRRRR